MIYTFITVIALLALLLASIRVYALWHFDDTNRPDIRAAKAMGYDIVSIEIFKMLIVIAISIIWIAVFIFADM